MFEPVHSRSLAGLSCRRRPCARHDPAALNASGTPSLPAGVQAAKRLAGTLEVGMTELSSATREALLRVGTSTLTGILSRRGLRNMFLQDVWPIRPDLPRMVGLAFTMRFIRAREDKAAAGRGSLQQKAMEECPSGHVLVVDARGDARAASAGDLFVGRLKAR